MIFFWDQKMAIARASVADIMSEHVVGRADSFATHTPDRPATVETVQSIR